MSRSSPSGSDRSARRAQASPVTGLIVAVVVAVAVSAYALTLLDGGDRDGGLDDGRLTDDEQLGSEEQLRDDEPPNRRDATVAATTLARVHDVVTSGGVAVPARLATATEERPHGYRLSVTLTAGRRTWHAGATPPAGAVTAPATREVGVAVGPGRIRPGRLRVEVWQ
ncbi:MAG: hypothetical protein ABEH80_00125 [Halobaculum sp.]